MKKIHKLMILELIGGFLGWVWIIAGIASIYFFIAAIAFKGKWSYFIWSLIFSAVAKWLTRGGTVNLIV